MESLGPLELDYLVDTLRNPPPATTVRNVLSYLYNYVPYVKHEHNLRIVIASFLNNPVCFGSPAFEDSYLVVEVVKLIFDKKLRVSQPTLAIKTFYEVFLRELKSFVAFNPVKNSWKALPVLTGISLSNDLRDDLYASLNPLGYLPFFSGIDRSADQLYRACLKNTFSHNHDNNEIVNLAMLTLALKHRAHEDLNSYVSAPEQAFVVFRFILLMYGPQGYCKKYRLFEKPAELDTALQSLIMKHINKISVLLDRLFANLSYSLESYELVFRSLSVIVAFNQELNRFVLAHHQIDYDPASANANDEASNKLWFFFKSILFSQVLIFQGIMTRFVESRNIGIFRQVFGRSPTSTTEVHYTDISFQLLQCLYYTNFILLSIGQGGFDGYNFVYYVCLELCCKNNTPGRFQTFTRQLIGNYELSIDHKALNSSFILRSKVLFALGLFESYFQQNAFQDAEYEAFVYEVAFDLTENLLLADSTVTEAGHSVLLAFFSKTKNDRQGIVKVLRYFEVLAGQFPSRISATQLSMAVETLGKKIMTSPLIYEDGLYRSLIEEFLEFIHFKAANATSGENIKAHGRHMFTSALPIPTTDANSTLSQLPELSNTNVVEENKHKKLKDLAVMDVVLFGTKTGQEHFEVRQAPETVREGLIVAFLNVIPYLPLTEFERWLNKIWALILRSNANERKFLADKFWIIISENLDLNRCEVAYTWWYEKKQRVEQTNFARL